MPENFFKASFTVTSTTGVSTIRFRGQNQPGERFKSGPLESFGKCEDCIGFEVLQFFLLIKTPQYSHSYYAKVVINNEMTEKSQFF